MKNTLLAKHTNILVIYLLLVFISISNKSTAQSSQENTVDFISDWDLCIYHPNPNSNKSTIRVPNNIKERMYNRGSSCSSFIVTYDGFSPAAITAFEFAVSIWENSLESSVPIRVNTEFSPLGTTTLASAGPADYSLVPGEPTNTAYAIALAEKITGSEIANGPAPTSIDIVATFSSDVNFYFGTDANPLPNQIDFVSVVLHELGHGLGMFGFGRGNTQQNPTEGILRNNGFISIWDTFIENGSTTPITTFSDPSTALLTQFTSNNLFSNSLLATDQNGGFKPKTFAPSTFAHGSSYSHWDENTFPAGNLNSLMTPSISPGEAIHNPGLVTLGFMEDMGWSICGGSLTVKEFDLASIRVSPNPFMSSITIELTNNGLSDDYSIDIIDINGRVILNTSKNVTNGKIEISNLSNLKSSLYFVKITNKNNGTSITKKVIKS